MVGKLDRTTYGTQDAAERWAEHYSNVLTQAGFQRGLASPCHFYHPGYDLWVVVHGDDFFSVGEAGDQDYLHDVLKNHYEIKCQRISPDGPAKEIRVLGRVISYNGDGLQIEADPQHLETAASLLGLSGAKGVATPYAADEPIVSAAMLKRIRLHLEQGNPDEVFTEDLLSDQDTRTYMSVAARLNYLGFDRPDIQFAVKELMRRMSQPTASDMAALKRVVRYLLTTPRYVSQIPWQDLPTVIRVFADANWAGCIRTRKSTLGGVVCFGYRPVKAWSKTMSIVALSS